MKRSAQTVQLHALFEAIATNQDGKLIRGRRYRRKDNLSGDAYQYSFHRSSFDDGEEALQLFEQRRQQLLALISEQELAFLCRVFPIGPVSLQQLARESNLSVATWSRHIRQVYSNLKDKLFNDEPGGAR